MLKKVISNTKQFLILKADFEKKIEKLKNRQDKVLAKAHKLIDEQKLIKIYKKIKAIK